MLFVHCLRTTCILHAMHAYKTGMVVVEHRSTIGVVGSTACTLLARACRSVSMLVCVCLCRAFLFPALNIPAMPQESTLLVSLRIALRSSCIFVNFKHSATYSYFHTCCIHAAQASFSFAGVWQPAPRGILAVV